MTNVLFLHAHPDDEAIFTGGTIAALSAAGHEISVVFATGGELGAKTNIDDLAAKRKAEAIRACEILGVRNVRFLEYHDSGLDESKAPTNSLAKCDVDKAGQELAQIMAELDIETVFCDDENGIYGHPDHRMCHKIGVKAASLHGLDCIMETTVDGEYLHFVETHVVKDAFDAYGIDPSSNLYRSRSSRQHPGLTSIEITDEVRINGEHILLKRQALQAHSSQIPEDSLALGYDEKLFAQVYGHEWFRHHPLKPDHKAQGSILGDLGI
ncbi:MAG: PIG-L deacetylase family protein [Acidimicrobiia bacterium]